MEYFIDRVLTCTEKKDGNYLAIYNSGKLRYLINIEKGISFLSKQKLSGNIAAYSSKLSLLMKLLKWIPTKLLVATGIGKKVSLEIDCEVEKAVQEISKENYNKSKIYYNIIVGSYVEKQKMVLQCFYSDESKPTVYLKIGDIHSEKELIAETAYLSDPILTDTFKSPELCYCSVKKGNRYNIQGTKEFGGETVLPELNAEIYSMYRAISQSHTEMLDDEGNRVYFSHGDFVPWNIKKNGKEYIVFDWEYCGYRFYGFDLIHFAWQIENKINKKDVHQAFVAAIAECKKWDAQLRNYEDDELERMYLEELHKQFGEIL